MPPATTAERRPDRPWPERALLALLAAQLVPVGVLFPAYALTRDVPPWLAAFAVALAVLGAAALWGAWRRAPWALWAVVVLTALKLVVDAYNAALGLDPRGLPVALAIDAALLALAFRLAGPVGGRVTRGQRAFFAAVLALAAWVAVRGLFDPARLSNVIPFDVPPLHARFLGAMYLSGATFMVLALRARAWPEVRIVTAMVAIWTGMLGLVSATILTAFDWHRPPTWTWFVAYSAFPLVAAWLAWRQRGLGVGSGDEAGGGTATTIPSPLRAWLWGQGAVVTVLAVALLVAPGAVAAVWPWKITVPLARIYSAPFLSYGLGSFMAARAASRAEVRIPVAATLVFTAAVLAASIHHRSLFAPAAPATWLWFGGFTLATVVGARYVLAGRAAAGPNAFQEPSA